MTGIIEKLKGLPIWVWVVGIGAIFGFLYLSSRKTAGPAIGGVSPAGGGGGEGNGQIIAEGDSLFGQLFTQNLENQENIKNLTSALTAEQQHVETLTSQYGTATTLQQQITDLLQSRETLLYKADIAYTKYRNAKTAAKRATFKKQYQALRTQAASVNTQINTLQTKVPVPA